MDSWDMCCAFIERIMAFGDKANPTVDDCCAYETMELEIIKALNNNMLTPMMYDIVFKYYHLAKDRRKKFFSD